MTSDPDDWICPNHDDGFYSSAPHFITCVINEYLKAKNWKAKLKDHAKKTEQKQKKKPDLTFEKEDSAILERIINVAISRNYIYPFCEQHLIATDLQCLDKKRIEFFSTLFHQKQYNPVPDYLVSMDEDMVILTSPQNTYQTNEKDDTLSVRDGCVVVEISSCLTNSDVLLQRHPFHI